MTSWFRAAATPELVVDLLDYLTVRVGLDLAHIIPVDNVDRQRFLATDRFVRERARLIRDQQHASRAHIQVNDGQCRLVKRSEVVEQGKIWTQLDEPIRKVRGTVPASVRGYGVDVAARIGGQAGSRHPECTICPVGVAFQVPTWAKEVASKATIHPWYSDGSSFEPKAT